MNTVLARTLRLAGVAPMAVLVAATLGACSMFGGSKDKPAAKPATAKSELQTAQSELDAAKAKPKPPPGAQKPFPSLAGVPDKKPDTTTARQRLRIQEGLFADRKNARYVDGPVAGVPERRDTVQTGKRVKPVKPVVVQPGSAQQVARRTAARVDGVRIVTNGHITTITFGEGETSLPPGSGRTIVRVAQLQRYTSGTLTIVGRAASSEGSVRDRALARARAVANGLISLGVSGSKIRVSGSSKPGRAQAAIFISGGKAPKRPGGR